MPSLILNQDTQRVSLLSRRLEVATAFRDSDGQPRTRVTEIPLHDLDRVVIVGKPAISVPSLCELMDRGIPVFFTTTRGRWRGTLTPDNNLNAARRIRQYEQGTDPVFALAVARPLIHAKIKNQRRVLQRLAANRESSADTAHNAACDELAALAAQAAAAENLDVLRGVEGLSAARYFRRLGTCFPAALPFTERNRRPPKDPANALLSFAYIILLGEVETAVRAHGLDAAVGHLHCDTSRSPSLALDLVEPLRPAVADLLVLNIVNHLRVNASDHFEYCVDDGGTYLNETGRRQFFAAYEMSMTRRFSPVKDAPHTDFRRVIDDQVCAYIRTLETGAPPVFFLLP
jgi:CRISPR-associated protein Cas1